MSAMAISGGGLSAQLMHAMDEMSREVRAEQRDRAEQEANQALHEGLAEASELHEKADVERTGAIVGGAITAASGAAQFAAASDTRVPWAGANEGERATVAAANDRLKGLAGAASTAGSLGKISQDIAGTYAGHHEANAREHSARAQAASRKADAAQSEAQEAKQTSDKARDLYAQILSAEHAGTMAVLRG